MHADFPLSGDGSYRFLKRARDPCIAKSRPMCPTKKGERSLLFFALNCSNTFDAGQCKPSNSDASYRCSMWQRRFRGDLVVLVEFEKC